MRRLLGLVMISNCWLFDFIVLIWPLLRFEGRLRQDSWLGVPIVPGGRGELLHQSPPKKTGIKIIPYNRVQPVDIRVAGNSSVPFLQDLSILAFLGYLFRNLLKTWIENTI